MEKENESKVKIVVLSPFRDKFEKGTRYDVGTELEFDAERAQDVVSRELAEYAEPIG